jgi:hypothetical protein
MANVSHTLMPWCCRQGTNMEDDSSSISAFMDGSSGGMTCSSNGRPASLHISQPLSDQAP